MPRPAPRLRALPLALLLAAAPAHAAGTSPWVRSPQSEARLLDGGRGPGGAGLVAGVEIRLAPRFITYWRDPGDAGVPPTFSFAGSTNLAAAAVRYPAPERLDEAGEAAYGYTGGVVFPVLVTPRDPGKPVELRLALDYATCHDICLPAHADLDLALDPAPAGAARPAEAGPVIEALARVPRPARVGGDGAPAVAAVSPDGAGGFTVTATGAGVGAALFVEAPEGWAYEAGPPRVTGDTAVFPVKRVAHPEGGAASPPPVTLTLTGPSGAVEVEADPGKPG